MWLRSQGGELSPQLLGRVRVKKAAAKYRHDLADGHVPQRKDPGFCEKRREVPMEDRRSLGIVKDDAEKGLSGKRGRHRALRRCQSLALTADIYSCLGLLAGEDGS